MFPGRYETKAMANEQRDGGEIDTNEAKMTNQNEKAKEFRRKAKDVQQIINRRWMLIRLD